MAWKARRFLVFLCLALLLSVHLKVLAAPVEEDEGVAPAKRTGVKRFKTVSEEDATEDSGEPDAGKEGTEATTKDETGKATASEVEDGGEKEKGVDAEDAGAKQTVDEKETTSEDEKGDGNAEASKAEDSTDGETTGPAKDKEEGDAAEDKVEEMSSDEEIPSKGKKIKTTKSELDYEESKGKASKEVTETEQSSKAEDADKEESAGEQADGKEKAGATDESEEKGSKDEATAEDSGGKEKGVDEKASGKGGRGASIVSAAGPTKDDINPAGNCSQDATKHCNGVVPGQANLANCITFHVKNEKSGNDPNAIPISDGCKAEVRAFRIAMYKDLILDKKMADACKADIRKNCDDEFIYPEPGNIVACLREVNQVGKLSDVCKGQVLRAQMDAADDFKNDPQLNELCSAEAERLCKGVESGEGRVQDCLRSNRDKLAWDCQAELFRQEVENADDIRLNVRLFQACLNDQRKFCADVRYGDARVKDCLEDHRLDPDFSPRCKTEFDKMMERRATDFRLDSSLRKYCQSDIREICYPDAEDISDVANWDAKVIQCLQDYRDELKDPKCREQVHRVTARVAEDIRFDKPLADACYSDRQKLCKDVPDGMAQVFLCLQEHHEELKDVCRSALFDELVRFAEDIDFKFPMKMACSKELNKFCSEVPPGHAARVRCLQDKIDDTDMGEDCRKELNRDLKRSAEDYRLNYRLNKACLPEVTKLCAHACDKELEAGSVTCGGSVLKCLQESSAKISNEACKKELFAFDKLMVRDPLAFDFPLQRACANNSASLCKRVKGDHALTLACLRANRDKLDADCKAEEMRFSIMEASDIRLTPTLMNACGQELQGFCKDVPPQGGQAFKCLQEHLEDVLMGAACKGEVNLQELRHASNYRLDVRVRTECADDVERNCKDADKGEEGHALVLKCMVSKFKTLSGSCQTEVAYAVRMALWQYKKNASLTEPCDANVDKFCGDVEAKPINGVVVGGFGQCLVSAKRHYLSKECRVLVDLVAAPAPHAGGTIDPAKLEETLKKITELQAAAQAGGAVEQSGEGLVLTGWTAFIAILALLVVLGGAALGVYQRFFNPHRNYTLVVKGAAPGTV